MVALVFGLLTVFNFVGLLVSSGGGKAGFAFTLVATWLSVREARKHK